MLLTVAPRGRADQTAAVVSSNPGMTGHHTRRTGTLLANPHIAEAEGRTAFESEAEASMQPSHPSMPQNPPGVSTPDTDQLYVEQQQERAAEQMAFQMLAATVTNVACGTGRRARAIHLLLGLEKVLAEALGECGRDQYQKVIDRYLAVRHGRNGGAQ